MITLEQVRQLETRVKRAVELIDTLRGENKVLKERLEKSERRLRELETLVDGFRNDQDQIEQGIRDILAQLNALEDDINEEQPETSSPIPEPSTEAVEPVSEDREEAPVSEEVRYGKADVTSTRYDQEEGQEDARAEEEDEEDSPGQLDIF